MNTNPATAPYSFSQDGAAPCRGIEPCSPSVLSFMDTWVSAPVRIIAPRIDHGPQYRGIGECPF